MKYLLLIVIAVSFTVSLNTNESSNGSKNTLVHSKLEQVSIAEQYYDRLEVNHNFPSMLNKFLDRKALNRTEVPESVWVEIKNSIDYASFKTEVVEVIPNFYTDSEMQTILDDHANRPYVPITKLAFRKQLMIVAQKFIDINFMTMANSILSENGYNPLDL